ncbi:MAG: hypothetical protein J0L69_12905 [Bacteroidetes bacterium]|nr:hypothetical protein [Bacteroidota bacterium]
MLIGLMIFGCLMAVTASFLQWIKEKNSNVSSKIYLFLVVIGIVIASITSVLQVMDSKESENKLMNANTKLQVKLDSNIIIVTRALGEYHLKYDSAQKRIIQTIRDSIKTTVIQREQPTLIMENPNENIGEAKTQGFILTKDKKHFQYSFQSKDATSKDVFIYASLVGSNNYTDFEYMYLMNWIDGETIPKDGIISGIIERDTTYKFIVIWSRGWYRNISGQTIHFDKMDIYNNRANTIHILQGDTRKKIEKLINKKESGRKRK